MRLENLNCCQCGAPLQVPESAQFVTCNHCRASLVVRRMESVTLTESVANLDARLQKTEAELAQLVYQNRLAEEYRRWHRERKQFMTRDKAGNFVEPTAGASLVMMFLFGAIALGALANGMVGGGIIMLVVGTVMAIVNRHQADEYQRAYRRHLQRLGAIAPPSGTPSGEFLAQSGSAPTPEEYLEHLESLEDSTAST